MADEITTTASFLKDYGTLIAIPAAALVGSITYRMQKFADRKSTLIELRRKVYADYLGALFKQVAANTPENNSNHNLRLMELSVVSSDEVVRRVGELKQYLMDPETRVGNIENGKANELVANTILSMRRDCFEKSDLSSKDVIKIVPFK